MNNFYKDISRSSRLQMLFKIGAVKHLPKLKIKRDSNTGVFL